MDRLKRILRSKRFLIPVGLLIAYTLAGFFLVPFLVRHYVPRVLDETLHRPAAIGDVRFNPFVYTFEANDFSLSEPDGTPIAGFKRLFVDFELKSLFNWAWTFRAVTLEGPLVNAVMLPDGVLNLAKLAPHGPAAEPPGAKPGEPPRLIFEEVTIDQGEVDFTDRRQAEPARSRSSRCTSTSGTSLPCPTRRAPKPSRPSPATAKTLRWTGHLSLNPVASKGRLEIEKLQVATLWKFARDALNLESPGRKPFARSRLRDWT